MMERSGTAHNENTFCLAEQDRQAALLDLSIALAKANESLRNCQLLTYEARNELLQTSAAFKRLLDASQDEHIYDLAASLDLVTVTAFSSDCHKDGEGLQLIQRAIPVLQTCLNGTASSAECARVTEQVWTWLGSSNGLNGHPWK